MRGLRVRSAFILAALGAVGLGALALAGFAHPPAPAPGMEGYLPAITLPTVLAAAALDGINPCAFTVLLLVVTAMLATMNTAEGTVRELRLRMLARGGIFITAIFLTYLALGLGVLGTMGLFTRQHWPARIAALGAVFLGLWMMRDYFFPESSWHLRAPAGVAARARSAARAGTVPALLAGGFLIGLCTVPCSGAVYLGVLSLLAAQESRAMGYGYLLLYNVIFVLPLVAILAAAAARPALRRLTRWNARNHERVKLVLGGGVVGMGLLILATV